MAWSALRHILAVATDAADVSALTARLDRCGLPVIHAVEAMNVLTVLKYRPDVMVVHVRQGRELRAYYATTTARLHGVPVILMVPNTRLRAIRALIGALPSYRLVEHGCDDATLTTKIMAVITRNRRLP